MTDQAKQEYLDQLEERMEAQREKERKAQQILDRGRAMDAAAMEKLTRESGIGRPDTHQN